MNIIFYLQSNIELYNFNSDSKNHWQIVDDRVMGGISKGRFTINESNNGVFYGEVSTDNNGGFSSVRTTEFNSNSFKQKKNKTRSISRLKGDGKNYQFRVKSSNSDRHSYINEFETNGKWQEVTINFNNMFASFRGRKLGMGNYNGLELFELRFLIANKKNEDFKLEIDWIKVG